MDRITYFVGQGYNREGETLENLERKSYDAYRYLTELYGGFTAIPSFGGYKENGTIILEASIQVIVLQDSTPREIENTAKKLREIFEQTEVLYTVEKISAVGRI